MNKSLLFNHISLSYYNDKDDDLDRLIADYICGMTDHFATRKVEKINPGISKKLYFENV